MLSNFISNCHAASLPLSGAYSRLLSIFISYCHAARRDKSSTAVDWLFRVCCITTSLPRHSHLTVGTTGLPINLTRSTKHRVNCQHRAEEERKVIEDETDNANACQRSNTLRRVAFHHSVAALVPLSRRCLLFVDSCRMNQHYHDHQDVPSLAGIMPPSLSPRPFAPLRSPILM